MTNVPNFLNLSMSRHPCSPHPISSSIFTNHEDTDDTSHSLSANDSLLSVNTDTIILIATAAAAVADQLMISDIIILC